jgi:hypothetical protein
MDMDMRVPEVGLYACSCQCAERKKKASERRWVVSMRQCNYSAFNGYYRTPSDYSEVRCLKCRSRWRTKAAYVAKLRDARGFEEGA